MFTMRFYVCNDSHGNIHVQNAVAGMFGQHHVHTPADFAQWSAGVPKTDIVRLKATEQCNCGLKPGKVRAGLPTTQSRR